MEFLLLLTIFSVSLISSIFLFSSKSVTESENEATTKIQHHLEEVDKEWEANKKFFLGNKKEYWLENKTLTHICSVFDKGELIYWTSINLPSIKFLHYSKPGIYFDKLKEGEFLLVVKQEDNIRCQFFIPLNLKASFSSFYLNKGTSEAISTTALTFTRQAEKTSIKVEQGFLNVKVIDAHLQESFGQVLLFCLLLLSFVGLLFIGFYYLISGEFTTNNKLIYHLLYLLLLALFYVFVHFYLENKFEHFSMFNPSVFALGSIVSSFGELFLLMSIISLSQLSLLTLLQFMLSQVKQQYREILQWLVFYSFLVLLWQLIYHINFNSSWVYDVSESLFFSPFKIAFGGLVVLSAYSVYGTLKLFDRELKSTVLFYVVGFLVSLVIGFLSQSLAIASVLFVGYLVVVSYKAVFSKVLSTYFFAGLLASFLIANAVASYRIVKLSDEMERFATEVMSVRDVETEYSLYNAGKEIQKDKLIRDAVLGTDSKKQLAEQKIKKVYLKDLAVKYETEVLYFDYNGNCKTSDLCYLDYKQMLNTPENKTDFDAVYFKEGVRNNFSVDYYSLLPMKTKGQVTGFILLLSREMKQGVEHVMRRLKEDKLFERYQASANFDYTIFTNGKAVFSKGEKHLHEQKPLGLSVSLTKLFYQTPQNEGIEVLIYSPYSWLKSVVTNLSFYLILLFIPVFLIKLISGGYNYYSHKYALSARIKTVVLLTFIVPMVLLSIIIYTNIDNTYREELKGKYVQELERITPYIGEYAELYAQKIITKEQLENDLKLLAKQSAIKFNYFDAKGSLVFTNNKGIYQAGLLAHLIEPKAYHQIVKTPLVYQTVGGHIGKFQFTSIYGVIDGEHSSLGVVSIPYFNSDSVLNEKRIPIFSAFIIAFILLFLVFYLLSERLVSSVNRPLVMLSNRLKAVVLSENNEPLVYQSEDEIGLLVDEYNKMITKLDESKLALARSEKESAWREMAKQVAHEIKNPLTPMKLMLQHIQRRLKGNEQEEVQDMSKSMGALITHIDSLSDIATSFSTFAKMPLPINERFSLNEVVGNQIGLFKEEKGIELTFQVPNEELYVQFDSKLFARIITNLLLNAKQSGLGDEVIEINVKLAGDEKSACLQIADNGQGIPNKLREKVFLPNFTTKNTGSGIGLAVAKRGIEQGGGTVWFETEETVGTTFFIRLPLVE